MSTEQISPVSGGDDLKTCPYCAEPIRVDARKCRYCGEWLTEDTPPALVKPEAHVRAPEAQRVAASGPGLAPQPPSRRKAWAIPTVAAIVIAALATGGVLFASAPRKHVVHLDITKQISASLAGSMGSPCHANAGVAVRDAKGDIVASETWADGKTFSMNGYATCHMNVDLSVPDSNTYVFQVEGWPDRTVSRDTLVVTDWSQGWSPPITI